MEDVVFMENRMEKSNAEMVFFRATVDKLALCTRFLEEMIIDKEHTTISFFAEGYRTKERDCVGIALQKFVDI